MVDKGDTSSETAWLYPWDHGSLQDRLHTHPEAEFWTKGIGAGAAAQAMWWRNHEHCIRLVPAGQTEKAPRSNFPIHTCFEYHDEGTREIATPCACRYPGDHPWPPHGGENGRRLLHATGDNGGYASPQKPT